MKDTLEFNLDEVSALQPVEITGKALRVGTLVAPTFERKFKFGACFVTIEHTPEWEAYLLRHGFAAIKRTGCGTPDYRTEWL